MTRDALLDRTFLEHRAKLLDLAAFLDRGERCSPEVAEAADDDFRLEAMRRAIGLLIDEKPQRAKRILELLSDPSEKLLDAAPGKAASGVPEPRASGG